MFAPKRSVRSAAVRRHPLRIAGIFDGEVLSMPPKVWVARCAPGACNVNQHQSRAPQASASTNSATTACGGAAPTAAGRSRGFNSWAAAGQGRGVGRYWALARVKVKRPIAAVRCRRSLTPLRPNNQFNICGICGPQPLYCTSRAQSGKFSVADRSRLLKSV